MVEFQVDDHEALQDLANQKNLKFGGSISVRAEPGRKAMIVFIEDKAIHNQHTKRDDFCISIKRHWMGN